MSYSSAKPKPPWVWMQAFAGLEGGVGREHLGHVGLGAAGLRRPRKAQRLVHHQLGRAHVRVGTWRSGTGCPGSGRSGGRRPALAWRSRRPVDEPLGVADAFGRDQDALGVHAGRGCSGSPCPPRRRGCRPAPHICRRRPRWWRGSSSCGSAGSSGPCSAPSRMSTMKTESPSVVFVDLVARGGAGEQQHQVGVLGAAGPDLLAVDDVAVALATRDGARARWCRCRWSAR